MNMIRVMQLDKICPLGMRSLFEACAAQLSRTEYICDSLIPHYTRRHLIKV